MSAQHTPGPWMWDSDPIKGDPLNRVRYRVVARGQTITQCYYSSSDEQAEHDARLIAAAPDLLEALLTARDHIDMDALEVSHCKDAQRIREAIAKATGQKGGA